MHHRTKATAVTLILILYLLLTGCSIAGPCKRTDRQDPLYTAWDGIEFLGNEESADPEPGNTPPSIIRCFTATLPQKKQYKES